MIVNHDWQGIRDTKKGFDFVIKGTNTAALEAKKTSGSHVAVLAQMVIIEPQPVL